MAVFDCIDFDHHEEVVFSNHKESGLKAIIAIHNTHLGPAIGGCRMWNYASSQEALTDVLRLSRGMTYKNAMAGIPYGGGKSVIIGNAKTDKNPNLLQAFGRFVNKLGGRYISAEDVGTSPKDIAEIAKTTRFVAGVEGKSGDPSPFTAYGTFLGIKAAIQHKFGTDDLKDVRVAVQGLGHVGYFLCRRLHQAGAKLVVSDINSENLKFAELELDAVVVKPEEIYSQDVDIYAPCALGGTVNDLTLDILKAQIIAGCANNQLAEKRHDLATKELGILYTPDYVINAGGVINVSFEAHYDQDKAIRKIEGISDTLTDIFQRADKLNQPTGSIADEMAKEKIEAA